MVASKRDPPTNKISVIYWECYYQIDTKMQLGNIIRDSRKCDPRTWRNMWIGKDIFKNWRKILRVKRQLETNCCFVMFYFKYGREWEWILSQMKKSLEVAEMWFHKCLLMGEWEYQRNWCWQSEREIGPLMPTFPKNGTFSINGL